MNGNDKMKIADGIEMLELSMNFMGRDSTIYPTLIWDYDTIFLVDAGAANNLLDIKKLMEDASVPFGSLNNIIVTHQDIDHIGGINNIIKQLSHVKVIAHKEDKPYIEGIKKFIRLERIMSRIMDLPKDEQKKVLDMYKNSYVNVDITLTDSEELIECGGIIAIHTPGHTPGHICIYHKKSKTLIAGDVLNIVNGQLIVPNTSTMNQEESKRSINSLKELEKYDIENIVCYHGGLYNDNPNQKIKELNKGN